MEGEPQIAEHPYAEDGHPAVGETGEFPDPSDPLGAPVAAAPLSTDDHDAAEEDQVANDDDGDHHGDEGGDDDAPAAEDAMDEATTGFLDKVNSGTINSSQFLPAIVDLPEKVKKKRPRKPKEPAAAPTKPASAKKRKRSAYDSSDDSLDDDSEYQPSAPKKKSKSTKKSSGGRATRAKAAVVIKPRNRREAMFSCRYCDFKTETIGELNIHTFGNHDDSTRPTFLDMAEATVAKMADRNGTSRAALLRAILEDYGHVVEVNPVTARLILQNSVRRGIELGRLRTGVPGKKGANSIWLPSKEERRTLLQRFSVNPRQLHVADSTEKTDSTPPPVKIKLSGLEIKKRDSKKTPGHPAGNQELWWPRQAACFSCCQR